MEYVHEKNMDHVHERLSMSDVQKMFIEDLRVKYILPTLRRKRVIDDYEMDILKVSLMFEYIRLKSLGIKRVIDDYGILKVSLIFE